MEDGVEGVGVGWVENADNPVSGAGECGGRRASSSPQGVGVIVCALRPRCFRLAGFGDLLIGNAG